MLIIATMSRLLRDARSPGVRLFLNDFSSGFSSLNYVKNLPVDDLKIDKSFIDGLGESAVNDAIVRLIVNFAHTLGLKVTSEGVERERAAGGELDGNEVRSGPGFPLFRDH